MTTLPSPPVVVARAVELATNPDCNPGDLARIIKQDPAFTAETLRAANSAFYSFTGHVNSVDRAVTMMGIRAVRNLVLCFAVRGLAPMNQSSFPLDLFWEASLRRAAAAKCVAEQVGYRQGDDFFTLGLCQDLGLLIRVQEEERLAEGFADAIRQPASLRRSLELEYGAAHDEVGYSLLKQWKLSDDIAMPVKFHHQPDIAPEEYRQAARIALAAEAVADLVQTDAKDLAMCSYDIHLASLGVPREELEPLFEKVNSTVEGAAEMLQVKIGQRPEYASIVATASQGLYELSLSQQEATAQLEVALQEQQRIASRLRDLNAQLAEQATTDMLTGLPNRRYFNDALEREYALARRQGSPLSVLLVDVDYFKNCNDTYGHHAGDRVLMGIAQALQRNLRRCDHVARYGGEEFAVVLPFTSEPGGQTVAERLRADVAAGQTMYGDHVLSVTISIGGATITAGRDTAAPEELVGIADKALYAAKNGGRNQVYWGDVPPSQGTSD